MDTSCPVSCWGGSSHGSEFGSSNSGDVPRHETQDRTSQERPGVWLQMGDRARMAGARSPRTAPRKGTQLYPGEKGAAGRVPARGAPGADPGAPGEAGGASGSTAAGADPTGRDPTPRVPAPRGNALPVALPDRASDALVGLVRSEEAPGPDRARRRRVGRGRGGGKGRRQTPPPPRPVPSPARRPAPLLRASAPPRRDGGHRAALRARGWRQGGAGRRPKGTGVRMGGGKGPRGQGCGREAPLRSLLSQDPSLFLDAALAGHLPTSLLAAHSPISWPPGVSTTGPGAPYSPLTQPSAEWPWEAAESSCQASPSRVPLAQNRRAAVGLVLCSGTRSSVTHGSQCVSCTGVPATQR